MPKKKRAPVVKLLMESRTMKRDLDVHCRMHDLEYELATRRTFEEMGDTHKMLAPYMRLKTLGAATFAEQMVELERLRKKHREAEINDECFIHPADARFKNKKGGQAA